MSSGRPVTTFLGQDGVVAALTAVARTPPLVPEGIERLGPTFDHFNSADFHHVTPSSDVQVVGQLGARHTS